MSIHRLLAARAGACVAIALALCAPAVSQPEVLDLDEAARLLRLTPEAVERLARAGQIPARQLDGQWRFSRSGLLAWLARSADAPMTAPELSGVTGRQQPAASKTDPMGQRPASPAAEAVALRDQGGFLRRGSGSFELAGSYARSEQTLFPVVRVETRTTTALAALRFVPVDGLQVAARLPYVWQSRKQFVDATAGSPPVSSTSDNERGDASLSLLAQVLNERSGRPNLLFSLDGSFAANKSRSHGAGASLVVTKSIDPAVLFAGLSYMRGLDAERIDERNGLARNNFGLNLGYTYAVNDSLALNALFAGSYRSYAVEARGTQAGTLPPPRENYALQFGATWMLARGLFVEPAVSVRIASDRPDMTFTLSVPYSF